MEDNEKDEGIEPHDTPQISPTINNEELTEEGIKHHSHESLAPVNFYQIKPNLQEKFKELPVKHILKEVQDAILGGKSYDVDNVKKWTIKIANDVNEKVKVFRIRNEKI